MRRARTNATILALSVLVLGVASVAVATGDETPPGFLGSGPEFPAVEVPAPEVSDFYVVEPSVPVAYIATGLNFPDALAAGPPAALGNGPVLLVKTDWIPPAVETELSRLNPDKIVISGGSDVVSDGVAAQLSTYASTGVVERLEGPTRYETAVEVSKANFPAAPIGVAADSIFATVHILDTCTDYDGLAVVIAPPVAGTVVIHANVMIEIDHSEGTYDEVLVGIRSSPTDCTFDAGFDGAIWEPSSSPTRTLYSTLPLIHIAEVDPGMNWFYVTGIRASGLSAAFYWGGMDAMFYPNP
jgi:hypothetical protein